MMPLLTDQTCNNWHFLNQVFDLSGKISTHPSTVDFNSAGSKDTVWKENKGTCVVSKHVK